MDVQETTDLVCRLQAGDEAAYAELVVTYGPRLIQFAEQFMGCPHEAQDCVQDVFLQAFRKIAGFRREASLSTWLHRILINNCLGVLRGRKGKETLPIEPLLPEFDWTGGRLGGDCGPSRNAEELLIRDGTRRAVSENIGKLPEDYRTILILRDIEGYSTQEVAEMLTISVPTAKVRLHRARAALRKLLEPLLWEAHA